MGTPGGGNNSSQRPLTPSDMQYVDKIFTGYMTKTHGSDTDARMKTITYLTRVAGWEYGFARRAAAIAIEDGGAE